MTKESNLIKLCQLNKLIPALPSNAPVKEKYLRPKKNKFLTKQKEKNMSVSLDNQDVSNLSSIYANDTIDVSSTVKPKVDFFTEEQKQTISNVLSYIPVIGTYYGICNAIEASKAEGSTSLLETIKIIVQISSFLVVPQLLLGAGYAVAYTGLAIASAVDSFAEFIASRKDADPSIIDPLVGQSQADLPVKQFDQPTVDQNPVDQTQGQ